MPDPIREARDLTAAQELVNAGSDVIRASDTLMLMLIGDMQMTKQSLEAALRRTLDARNEWHNVLRRHRLEERA